MTFKSALGTLLQQEDLNFLLTNRIPRQTLTRFMGWFSRIENRLISVPSLWAFRLFADDLDLHEARKARFRSLHECFIRELKEGARPIDRDPSIVVSPCDAIVGVSGRVRGNQLFQAKGLSYTLEELLRDEELVARYRDGTYATLRLQASMYHRFHAPHDSRVERLTYVSGDTWNVNPIAVRRIAKLFARNERAIIRTTLIATGHPITLVPVAAVLVASMRFTFVDVRLHLRYAGPNQIPCAATLHKGEEMGRFEHGSTILVFAPPEVDLVPEIREGRLIRMGQPLFRLP